MDAVLHLLSAGDHVILSDDVYGGSFRILDKVFRHLGLATTRVDMTNLRQVEAALTPRTRLVWVETPSNPMLKVIDVRAAAQLVQKHRSAVGAAAAGAGMTASPGPGPSVLLVVDNTFATPYLQNPLSLGADVVTHSCTKYIGGHSDVVGGALILNDEALAARLKFIQNAVGAVPGPMDCFFLLRSTKTLHVRMARHCENAAAIAEWLEGHARVERVYYPGLKSHPQHAIAERQMCGGYGGMISCVLRGGLEAARRFLERVRIFSLAESLGGVESLIEHPAIMTHASIPADARAALGIADGLVRLSVGIEDVDDLVEDLEQALG
jgi:cystathionine gamma-lyase